MWKFTNVTFCCCLGKPYECPNCKNVFPILVPTAHTSAVRNVSAWCLWAGGREQGSRPRSAPSPSLSASPGRPHARPQMRQKTESKPLQRATSRKPDQNRTCGYEFKPIVVASGINCSSPLYKRGFQWWWPLTGSQFLLRVWCRPSFCQRWVWCPPSASI